MRGMLTSSKVRSGASAAKRRTPWAPSAARSTSASLHCSCSPIVRASSKPGSSSTMSIFMSLAPPFRAPASRPPAPRASEYYGDARSMEFLCTHSRPSGWICGYKPVNGRYVCGRVPATTLGAAPAWRSRCAERKAAADGQEAAAPALPRPDRGRQGRRGYAPTGGGHMVPPLAGRRAGRQERRDRIILVADDTVAGAGRPRGHGPRGARRKITRRWRRPSRRAGSRSPSRCRTRRRR